MDLIDKTQNCVNGLKESAKEKGVEINLKIYLEEGLRIVVTHYCDLTSVDGVTAYEITSPNDLEFFRTYLESYIQWLSREDWSIETQEQEEEEEEGPPKSPTIIFVEDETAN